MRTLALLLALSLLGCGGGSTLVPKSPPPPKTEQRPLKPGSEVFWRTGYWVWQESEQHFYWEPGRWEQPKPGRVWIPGYWEAVGSGKERRWRWTPPRWEKVE